MVARARLSDFTRTATTSAFSRMASRPAFRGRTLLRLRPVAAVVALQDAWCQTMAGLFLCLASGRDRSTAAAWGPPLVCRAALSIPLFFSSLVPLSHISCESLYLCLSRCPCTSMSRRRGGSSGCRMLDVGPGTGDACRCRSDTWFVACVLCEVLIYVYAMACSRMCGGGGIYLMYMDMVYGIWRWRARGVHETSPGPGIV
jgi:hypothetical protein